MILKRLGSFVYRWAWRFYEDGCLLHASALAYTTMLSIVPVLALMFAALKGLGVESELEELLLERLSLCLLYTSPSPRDATLSRMPSSA